MLVVANAGERAKGVEVRLRAAVRSARWDMVHLAVGWNMIDIFREGIHAVAGYSYTERAAYCFVQWGAQRVAGAEVYVVSLAELSGRCRRRIVGVKLMDRGGRLCGGVRKPQEVRRVGREGLPGRGEEGGSAVDVARRLTQTQERELEKQGLGCSAYECI
ncbi:hypothetical protein Tco_0439013 [Tanacetum coccineum]|uniref:Uncharacterized protein n=1 Tax=Tanacetum coccineum TaxID=301880 RepID=A0ABQ5FL63_9ASTR